MRVGWEEMLLALWLVVVVEVCSWLPSCSPVLEVCGLDLNNVCGGGS